LVLLLVSSNLSKKNTPAFFSSIFLNSKLPTHHCYCTANQLSFCPKMNNPCSKLCSGKIFRSSITTGHDHSNSLASLSSVIGSIIEELFIQSPSSEQFKSDVDYRFSLTQASGTDDDMNSLDQFCQICTTDVGFWNATNSGKSPVDNHSATAGGSPNIVVMHKNSSDVPSVTGGSVPVCSHISEHPFSSVPPASHPKLVHDGTHLYFSFAKHGVKAGCLHCKDLLEIGSSMLKHLQICPRVTGAYKVFESDSESKEVPIVDCMEVTMDPGLMVEDVGLPVVDTIAETVIPTDVSNLDDNLSSVGLHWKDFFKWNVDYDSSFNEVDVWVEEMYASANNLASFGYFGLLKYPLLPCEDITQMDNSYVLCYFIDPKTKDPFLKCLSFEESLQVCVVSIALCSLISFVIFYISTLYHSSFLYSIIPVWAHC
jgi:hypothetical protein